MMPRKTCRALALLNLGNTSATVVVALPSDGVGGNLTNIFGGTSSSSSQQLKMAVPAQGAELFMLSDGDAEQCASAPPPPPPPAGGWKLVWSDEFDGPAGAPPNASYWSVAGVAGNGVDPTHGPVEQQLYVPEAVALDGKGHVVIETKRERCEKRLFAAICILQNMIILPGQARDKHRKSLRTRRVSQGALPRRIEPTAVVQLHLRLVAEQGQSERHVRQVGGACAAA
jgi:hypothetical protein